MKTHYSTMYVRLYDKSITEDYRISTKQEINDLVVELFKDNLGSFEKSEYFPKDGLNGDMLCDHFENGRVTVMQYSKLK